MTRGARRKVKENKVDEVDEVDKVGEVEKVEKVGEVNKVGYVASIFTLRMASESGFCGLGSSHKPRDYWGTTKQFAMIGYLPCWQLHYCHEPGSINQRSIPTGDLHPLAIPPQSDCFIERFIEAFVEAFNEDFNKCFNEPFQASHPRSNTNGPVQQSLQ